MKKYVLLDGNKNSLVIDPMTNKTLLADSSDEILNRDDICNLCDEGETHMILEIIL